MQNLYYCIRTIIQIAIGGDRLDWTFVGGLPIWSQLCDKIKRAIVLGEYKPNERIPGVRELAAEAQVNPNTMQRALAKLEEEGMLVTHGTGGRFVSADVERLCRIRKTMLGEAAREYLQKCAEFGITSKEAITIIEEEGDSVG